MTAKVSFNTPAFLGDAFQQARWRTPPFKWLLRRWWRIVHAPGVDYDVARLRSDELELFGSASDDSDGGSGQSQVRLSLSDWSSGTMKNWNDTGMPQVKSGKYGVSAALYLGFGPLDRDKDKGVKLASKNRTVPATAIDPACEAVNLRLTAPQDSALELAKTVQLLTWFGSAGSRARNGWGSLDISEDNLLTVEALLDGRGTGILDSVDRPLEDCLKLDWPHAIGRDNRGALVWTTSPQSDWKKIIGALATLKKDLLSLLSEDKSSPGQRHVFNYPVTKKELREWNNARLANQVCFKVARLGKEQLCGIVYHLPCATPKSVTTNDLRELESRTWRTVHQQLDASKMLSRIGKGDS